MEKYTQRCCPLRRPKLTLAKAAIGLACGFAGLWGGVVWSQSGASAADQASVVQIGEVPVAFANVAQAVSVLDGNALLGANASVTARDATAVVRLKRGGSIHICATTALHLSQGSAVAGGSAPAPLLLSLDRGAIELHMPVTAKDAILSPDLRFQMVGSSPALDLLLRVSRNGDTCVDNRGKAGPVVAIAEQLGDATYLLQPGQHVLFEHGSLKEVVDNEPSPCGCPPDMPISVADSGATSARPAAPGTAVAEKDSTHPFPIAVSEGLAQPPQPAASKPGEVVAQITMPLTYNGDAPASGAPVGASSGTQPNARASDATPSAAGRAAEAAPPTPPANSTATAPSDTAQSAKAPEPTSPDLVHIIGRFFKRIFRRS